MESHFLQTADPLPVWNPGPQQTAAGEFLKRKVCLDFPNPRAQKSVPQTPSALGLGAPEGGEGPLPGSLESPKAAVGPSGLLSLYTGSHNLGDHS